MTKLDWDSGEGGSGLVPDTVSVIAGEGLLGGGALSADVTIDAGAGDGISVSADAISIQLATPSGLSLALGELQIDDAIAGSGLSIGSKILSVYVGNGVQLVSDAVTLKLQTTSGLVVTSSGLAVGAGNGIQVDTNSITIKLASPSGLGVSTSGLYIDDAIAGAGLSISAKVLAVNAGNGITISGDAVNLDTPGTLSVSSTNVATGNHTHAITTSSAPGTASSIVATNSSGLLELVLLNVSSLFKTDTIESYSGGNLTIQPGGDVVLDPTGNDVLPGTGYTVNLGMLSKKYLTIHAAELWVETLVAQDTIATIGGRIIVAPTTTLVADLTTGVYTIHVKHNQIVSGDILLLEANGNVEFMQATTGYSGTPGDYTYTVTRDLDGSGENNWYAGDAVVNTGGVSNGYIDIYSTGSIVGGGTGSAIAGMLRTSTTYNGIVESWAIGDLNGLYGYASQVFGVALGRYEINYSFVTIDDTDGIQLKYKTALGDVTRGQWKNDGTVIIGSSATNVTITPSGVIDLVFLGVNRVELSGSGLLINNSAGDAVFTLNNSAGAEFTLPLTLATTGGIYQGSGTFSTPSTGLKIYNSGGYGKISGYNLGTEQWYAGTDGKLYAGGGKVTIADNGISLTMPAAEVPDYSASVKWYYSGNLAGILTGYRSLSYSYIFVGLSTNSSYVPSGIDQSVGLSAYSASDAKAEVTFYVSNTTENHTLKVSTSVHGVYTSSALYVDGGIHIGSSYRTYTYANDLVVEGGITVGFTGAGDPTPGDIYFVGTLYSKPSTTSYNVYAFHPLESQATSTSFAGNSFSTVSTKTRIYLQSGFGLPTEVKAISVRLAVRDSGAASNSAVYFALSPSTSAGVQLQLIARPAGLPNDYWVENNGIVPVNTTTNDVYYQCVASGTSTLEVYIVINGYWI